MNKFYKYPYQYIQNIPYNRSTPSQNVTNPPKKKLDFKCLKNNTCKSLNDVEHFLGNFSSFIKYIKLYGLLKK